MTATTADALLRAILDDPADDLPRLAYADWLEENYDERRRCPTCHGRNWSVDWKGGTCPTCWNTPMSVNLTVDATRLERAEFIRVQLELARWTDADGYMPMGLDRETLRRREQELLGVFCSEDMAVEFGLPCHETLYPVLPSNLLCVRLGVELVFRRGFVAEIRLATADFLTHAAALFAANPVERVTLTDREPFTTSFDSEWRWYDGDTVSGGLIHPESNIPRELYYLLRGGVQQSSWCVGYASKADADAALSDACVRLGRARAKANGE